MAFLCICLSGTVCWACCAYRVHAWSPWSLLLRASCDLVTSSVGSLLSPTSHSILVPSQNKTRLGLSLAHTGTHLGRSPHWDSHTSSFRASPVEAVRFRSLQPGLERARWCTVSAHLAHGLQVSLVSDQHLPSFRVANGTIGLIRVDASHTTVLSYIAKYLPGSSCTASQLWPFSPVVPTVQEPFACTSLPVTPFLRTRPYTTSPLSDRCSII